MYHRGKVYMFLFCFSSSSLSYVASLSGSSIFDCPLRYVLTFIYAGKSNYTDKVLQNMICLTESMIPLVKLLHAFVCLFDNV